MRWLGLNPEKPISKPKPLNENLELQNLENLEPAAWVIK